MPNGVVCDPHVFVSIAPDGIVTIVAPRAEMGTGAARTALPMIVADELDADWARVQVVQSPGDEKTYGNQDTDGSRSVRHFIQPMRQCGAAARMMLEQAAAKTGVFRTPRCRRRTARGHAQAVRPQARLWRAGRGCGGTADAGRRQDQAQGGERLPLHRQGQRAISDLVDITTGKAMYGQDIVLPGMKFAVVARPAGGRRQGRLVRRSAAHEGAGRGEDREDRRPRRRRRSSLRSVASPSSPRTPGRR